MRTLSTHALVPFALTLLAVSLAGCDEGLPPGTSPARAPVAAGPQESLVTFVRPPSTCDTGEWAVVVDERGRFVGDVASGTRLSYVTKPGPHRFYAWSNVALDGEFNLNPVGAVRLTTSPGESRFVAVDVATPCSSRSFFELHTVASTEAGREELALWLSDTKPVMVDRTAGQLTLEAAPTHLHRHIELGDAKLQQLDDMSVRMNRHATLLDESSTRE